MLKNYLRILTGKNRPSDKTQMPTGSLNIDICIIESPIQLFIGASYSQIQFSEK